VVLVAAFVVVLDQLVKWFMVEYREGREPLTIVGDFLKISVIRNPGAAFGLGGGVTVVFSFIALVVAFVVIRQARTMTSTGWAVALGALLGGALGNLVDRLLREPAFGRGAVVDYVDVRYFSVFNLADAALTLSAISIAILALRGVPMTAPGPQDRPAADEAPTGDGPYSGL